MNRERWRQIDTILKSVLERPVEERASFLDAACAGDAELRRDVESLVAHDEAESFLPTKPLAALGAVAADRFAEGGGVKMQGQPSARSASASGSIEEARFVPGDMLAGRYRVVGLLGRGGMGEVYRADDLKLKQPVALKFLPERLSGDGASLARFYQEVSVARQISHRHVCRVYDVGEADGLHFISMEYVRGEELSSVIKRFGRLPHDKAVEIARQLCAGLAAIHERGVLHRDLKPANVMVDERGDVRITDFGLAALAEEVRGREASAGTPAYMSPEQLAGGELTVRSDIYSLGLVFYELFTGRRAFDARTLDDLLRLRGTTSTPTSPSSIVKDIDPVVERVIERCLEKEPELRPATALQVAAALPGGDPIAAALAAGETPSPAMVAAAPKKGALKPAVAVACLSAVVLLLAFIVFFAGRVKHHEWMPLEKSSEVLAERADSIVKKLGYTNAPVDTDYSFANNEDDYPNYARAETSPNRWERLRSGQPAMIYFWHRTSPRYLEPQRWEYSTVWHDDPPHDVAGMTKVILDVRGRLLEFQAVPPQVKDKTAQAGEVDWATLFAEAGLDIRNYRQTESKWTPPVFADASLSWEGTHVDHAEIPVRIEAAAYQGKPIYFQIIAPWDKPIRQEETFSTARRRAAGVILILIFLCVVAAAVFLAHRNLRQGRSDTKGAFKTSMFVFLVVLAAHLLYADHLPDLSREVSLLIKMVGNALFEAALIGLVYLALEPYVRRRWASLIISWNRLLVGDWRDPLVGRDILVGGLLGLGHTFAIYSAILSLDWSGFKAAPDFDFFVSTLQSFKHLWANFLTTTASAIFPAFFVLLFLVLLVTIFRKQWLATAVFWTLMFLILFLAFGGEEGQAYHVFFTALIPTLVVVCIARFGLLAMVSFMVFFHLSFHHAITAKFSSWYFGNTIFSAVVLLGLAIYGFHTSLAGQPLFKRGLLEE